MSGIATTLYEHHQDLVHGHHTVKNAGHITPASGRAHELVLNRLIAFCLLVIFN